MGSARHPLVGRQTWALVTLALLGLACAPPPRPAQDRSRPTKPSSTPSARAQAERTEQVKPAEPTADAPQWRAAGSGDVAALVQTELAAAEGDGYRLVVYVGAPWCEPCVAFHDALVGGQIDDEFRGLRFLEFNMDVDEDRLAAAGYRSRLIPLFVIPNADGTAGPRRSEGGVKGPDAVPFLIRKLAPVLTPP